MKTKELKNIAKQITKQELIIRNSADAKEIRKAQDAIMDLSGRVEKLEDMVAIDEFVQEILEKI